jgi:thiol-disulfide isomerase/thioredoxin
MKNIRLLIIGLLLCVANTFAQNKITPLTASAVLSKAEQYIKSIKTISYYSSYKQIYSGLEDSVLTAGSQVWLQALPADTIFSARFHMSGENKSVGNYDYFYDGINSFEINHKLKEVRLVNPRLFDNNENNPAKARMALYPFNTYFTDANFKKHVLAENTGMTMDVQPKQYVVRLAYPADKLGNKQTRTFYINKKSFTIERVVFFSLTNGTRYTSDVAYRNILLNNKAILQHIPVVEAYKDYKVKEKKPDIETKEYVSPLIGMTAKSFAYRSFDNQEIGLAGLKGKYVLLDFWESWCGHCIMSIPEICKLAETYGPSIHSCSITGL